MNKAALLLIFSIFCCSVSFETLAHRYSPSLLLLEQQALNKYRVSWKTPNVAAEDAAISPKFPINCDIQVIAELKPLDIGYSGMWTLACPDGIKDKNLGVHGIEDNNTNVIVRIKYEDGAQENGVINKYSGVYQVKGAKKFWQNFVQFISIGFEHILAGFDHLLFVLGMMLLVTKLKPLVFTLTAFTLGHTLTIALYVLDVVRVAPALVELAIAMTIFWLAVQLTQQHSQLRCVVLGGVFIGLIHGMGFASALLDIGLPANAIAVSLIGFNIGVELGQIFFVSGCLFVSRLLVACLPKIYRVLARPTYWLASYAIGSIAVYWILERSQVLL